MNSRSSTEARRCQPWLGTYVEIAARASDEAALDGAIQAAFAAVARAHRLMSFHDPASDVSRLNQRAARAPVTVAAWTYQVLREAKQLHEISGGVFDVAVVPSLMAWGFLPSAGANAPGHGTTADIELLPEQRVRFQRSLAIDLGGIAKGFAVDRAVEALQASGALSGGVNAGGDLRVFGSPPQSLRVRHPRQPAHTIVVGELHDEAAATSAGYFARRRREGRWVSPILDSRTGRPWLGRASVSVIARNCLLADALTKIVALAPDRAPAILAQCDARAVMISDTRKRKARLASCCLPPCTWAA